MDKKEGIDRIKKEIFNSLCNDEKEPPNYMPVYIDGVRYKSLFAAGIDGDISFRWLSQRLAESNGAPVKIKNHLVVFESWVREHPECLL